MKFCPSCGSELRSGAKFCISCGKPLPVEQEQPFIQQPYQQPIPSDSPSPITDFYAPSHQQQGSQQTGYAPTHTQTDYAKLNPDGGIVSRVINMIVKPHSEWVDFSVLIKKI